MRVCSPHCGIDAETISGGETYERELLVRLAGLGVVNDLILARHKRVPEGLANLGVHRLPIARGLRWPIAAMVLPPAIARVYRQTRFDLLRVHSLRYTGPAALLARRLYHLDVPIVSHHHHLDPSPLNRLIEKRVVEASDRVVVGSEFGRRQLAAELGVRTDHVSVVYYGVDPALVSGPPPSDLLDRYRLRGHSVVLFLGGLKPRKNLFLLLDVWAPVAAREPEARLVIAGGGPLRADLERHARRLGLEGRVVFTGYVPEAEKAAHFRLADVFLFPSAMEGFGFSVAEAMSAGVPVVASDRGSIPELVAEGQSGFVCDPSVPDRFVERLLLLLGDAALREKFGAAARERADRLFRWEACVDGTRRVYEETLSAWRRRGARPTP